MIEVRISVLVCFIPPIVSGQSFVPITQQHARTAAKTSRSKMIPAVASRGNGLLKPKREMRAPRRTDVYSTANVIRDQ